MSAIRLIATDLDGTLLRGDGSISGRTRRALGWAREAGLAVVFVTARPPRDVHAIAEDLGITGMAVCSNGAILYDVATNRVIRREDFPSDLARQLVADLRQLDPAVRFATEHGHKVGYEPDFPRFFDDFVHHHEPRVDHAHRLCEEDLIKLLVHHPAHEADALAALIGDSTGPRAVVTRSGAEFVEIGLAGVSKASGLLHLAEDLGLGTHEIIAFGDMPNDLPMLKLAGRGVAVANAHPEVLAEVRETTHSNEDDGVAVMIEALLG
jgi:Cof subfamily protein (haloacid dehalogenase superfamily)